MTGVVDEAAGEASLSIPGAEHADLGINGSRVAEDVGVALSGMAPGLAVLHTEAAVERHAVLVSVADRATHRGAGRIGLSNGGDDLGDDALDVAGVGATGVFVSQLPHEGRSMVVLAGTDHAHGSGGVGVRGGDQHVLRGDAAARGDSVACGLDEVAGRGQRVYGDQGHALGPFGEDGGARLARVVEGLVEGFEVAARLLHADFGRDVAFRETGLEDGGGSRLRPREGGAGEREKTGGEKAAAVHGAQLITRVIPAGSAGRGLQVTICSHVGGPSRSPELERVFPRL